jgi:hypothetical protein
VADVAPSEKKEDPVGAYLYSVYVPAQSRFHVPDPPKKTARFIVLDFECDDIAVPDIYPAHREKDAVELYRLLNQCPKTVRARRRLLAKIGRLAGKAGRR